MDVVWQLKPNTKDRPETYAKNSFLYVNVDFTKIPLNVVKAKFRDFYGFTFLLLLNNIGTTLDRPRKKRDTIRRHKT